MARVEPGALVRPFTCDRRDLLVSPGGTAFSRMHLAAPAFLHRGEQVQGVTLFVGEDHVFAAVFVDIDKAQAIVLALSVNQRRARWKGKWQPGPSFLLFEPGEDRLLLVVADKKLAAAGL